MIILSLSKCSKKFRTSAYRITIYISTLSSSENIAKLVV